MVRLELVASMIDFKTTAPFRYASRASFYLSLTSIKLQVVLVQLSKQLFQISPDSNNVLGQLPSHKS